MNFIAKLVVVYSGVFLLSGCSTGFLNEGAIQVRSNASVNSSTDFKQIYFKPDNKTINNIEKDNYFSISLLSAHICGFHEMSLPDPLHIDDSNQAKDSKNESCTASIKSTLFNDPRITRGEIAIAVNVGEMSATKTPLLNPVDISAKGRVIYYNEDIRKSGQLINAINMPIYGPKKYLGKNVFLDLWMLELDSSSGNENKVSTLLSSLADLGGKAYPPSAPVLGVLNMLGGAFLSKNKDDVEARFQMRFDVPSDPNSHVARLPLAEGYYAFVREEDRNQSSEWDNIKIDEKQGVLCKANNGVCSSSPDSIYREHTWFLIRVAKETKDSALDIEYGEALNNFLKKLEAHEDVGIDNADIEIKKLSDLLKKKNN